MRVSELVDPCIRYASNAEQYFERQHSIIVDLTSLVHSIHASLDICHKEAEVQQSQSIHTLDAVAIATGELAIEKTLSYEMERKHYMVNMEMRLENLEDEALGAIRAVADAAGKRKSEEEGRWKSYTEEAESVLRSVRKNVDNECTDESVEVGVSETSVLRAAISHRLEEGIASLQRYNLRPHNNYREAGKVETITTRLEEEIA